MSYTPPKTRTKDDANKELKEIELKINAEKSKLYVVVKDRENAEAGFVAREQKALGIERMSFEKVEDLKLEIVKYSEEIKNQKIAIKENCKIIAEEVEEFNSISLNIQSIELTKEEKSKELCNIIEEKKLLIKSLDEDIRKSRIVIKSLDEEIATAKHKKLAIERETENIVKECNDRENALAEREIKQEQTLSNIRTISVRLHQKYGDSMTPFELKQTKI